MAESSVQREHVLAVLGALGCLTLLGMPLPEQALESGLSEPALRTLSIVQPAVLIALALWVGNKFAARAELSTPWIDALLYKGRSRDALRVLVGPSVALGALAAGLALLTLAVLSARLPERFLIEASKHDPPLLVRLGYGSLSEEIMMRWGALSLAVCWSQKLLRGRSAHVAAIAITAIAFGAAHLPYAAYLAGGMTGWLAAYVLIGNAALGVVTGWLAWRRGLEAAMLAHAIASIALFVAGRWTAA